MANREYKSRYVTLVPSQTANHNVSVTTNTVRSNNFDVSDANAVTIEVWVKSIGANASATISLEHSATSGGTYSAVPENQGENVTADEVGVYRIAYLGDNRFVRAVVDPDGSSTIAARVEYAARLDELKTAPRD